MADAIEGIYNATPPVLGDGQQAEVQLDSSGRVLVANAALVASGVSAVTGSFTATGQSASFTPVSGRDFNVSMRVSAGNWAGSIQLERSFDGGTNWHPLTAGGTQIGIWTAPFSEIFPEPQFGVLYRLNCTSYTSGTATYRLSQ